MTKQAANNVVRLAPTEPEQGDTNPLDRRAERATAADWNPMRPMKPKTVAEAMQLMSGATMKRAIGKAMLAENGDITGSRFELAEAEAMEKAAGEYLDIANHTRAPVTAGNGGEMAVPTKEAWANIPGVIETVREGADMLTASASRQRLELTGNTLPMAVDAAESIKPQNSLEKMLAHQMAASHRVAMQCCEQAAKLVDRPQAFGPINQTQSIEAARLANAAARMMSTFQEGLLTLDKIRRGGKQTVKVIHQYVAVGPGGQAVVAGDSVKGTRGRGRRGSDRK